MWAAIINVLIGLWLMIAPDLFSFDKDAANNYYIVGPMVITMAIASIWEVNRSFRYFNLLAGIWLTVSHFVLWYETNEEIANSLACGVALICFSLVKGKITRQFGGGWKVLFSDNAKAREQ